MHLPKDPLVALPLHPDRAQRVTLQDGYTEALNNHCCKTHLQQLLNANILFINNMPAVFFLELILGQNSCKCKLRRDHPQFPFSNSQGAMSSKPGLGTQTTKEFLVVQERVKHRTESKKQKRKSRRSNYVKQITVDHVSEIRENKLFSNNNRTALKQNKGIKEA